MRLLLLISLVIAGNTALACNTKPLDGYEGPCEIEGWMGFAQRYFYTRPAGSEEGYKRWDLQTGKVVADGLSHQQAQQIPPEALRYDYPRQPGDNYVVLAEARDKPVALLGGRIGDTEADVIVYDLAAQAPISTFGAIRKGNTENYDPGFLSPDGSLYAYQSSVRDAATGNERVRIPEDVVYAADLSAAFGVNDRHRPTRVLLRQPDDPARQVQSWASPFAKNQGMYPIDPERAWVFLRHYQKYGSKHTKVAHSNTGGLYLVNFANGDVEQTILFDAGESAYERELREYMKTKFRYARARFEEQVSQLQTPAMYLLREEGTPKEGANTLDGDRYLALYAGGRTMVYDLEQNKPTGMFYSTIYKHYPDGNYGGSGVSIKQGLGPAPAKGRLSVFGSIWLPESNTILNQGHDTIYEYTPEGRFTGKKLEQKNLVGYLGNRQVVTLDRKSKDNRFTLHNLAVHDLDTGEQVRRLYKKKVDYAPNWLSGNGHYAVISPKKGKWLVIDTRTGDKVTEFEPNLRAHKLVHNGVLNMHDGTYMDFATLKPEKLAWSHKRDYSFLRFQGQYIVTFTPSKGIEVFDLETRRYITPVAIHTGMHEPGTSWEFMQQEAVYLPKRNAIAVVVSGGYGLYGKRDDAGKLLPAEEHLNGKRATGYLLDLDALSLSPIMATALPWEDPLVAMKAAAREQKKREEEQRREQEFARQQQQLRQEKALISKLETYIAQTPETERIALFYPDGPIGPYVSDARKAQALVEHMKLWERPNFHSSSYGLTNVPFQFIEDMLPLMPEQYARQARSVIHRVRARQLTRQQQAERQAGWEKLKQAMADEVRRSASQPIRKIETKDPVYEYQKKMFLEGKANRAPCSTDNPCGPGDMFRAYD